MTRLIVLTGAPTSSSLVWNENTLSNRLAIHGGAVHSTGSPESSRNHSAQWRQVPTGDILSIDKQQNLDPRLLSPARPAQFLKTAELTAEFLSRRSSTFLGTFDYNTSTSTATQDLDDFYGCSLAFHDDSTTSQVTEFQSQRSNHDDAPSTYDKTQVSPNRPARQIGSAPAFQITSATLNDVREIPSATYLRNIEPQTMTVNLVVGIMALPPPRLVTVGRRWGQEREMRLLELLVGDDTSAGFEITMWLSYHCDTTEESSRQGQLEEKVLNLRQRDIVLLRNVALTAYQGRVHGQSLRRDVTKVDLLYRRQLDASDPLGIYSSEALLEPGENGLLLQKTKRVKQWLIDFVGDNMPGDVGDPPGLRQPLLPPNTQ